MAKKKQKVGYGNPPAEHRFKPGQSGNKKGRPKGSKNTYTLLNEILDQKITIKENGQPIKISKKLAMLMQLVNKGIQGELKAITALLPHLLMADITAEEKEKALATLNTDDRKIIENYLSRFDDAEEVTTDNSHKMLEDDNNE